VKEKFKYSYTAPTEEERMEIESIRRKYVVENTTETDIEKLKRLDMRVRRPPKILAISLGVIGALVFGVGLTFIMEWNIPVAGYIVGVAGALIMAAAYPAHKYFLAAGKKKYGAEIIALSDKILDGEDKN